MNKPRQFEEQEVIELATRQFLISGYACTSMSTLEDCTGVGRKSLYNAIGDKKTLFIRSLESFAKKIGEQKLVHLETSDANADSVLNLFDDVYTNLAQHDDGCLMCNTAREPIADDPDVKQVLQRYFSRLESSFGNAIANELCTTMEDQRVASLAAWLSATLISLSCLIRCRVNKRMLESFYQQSTTVLQQRLQQARH